MSAKILRKKQNWLHARTCHGDGSPKCSNKSGRHSITSMFSSNLGGIFVGLLVEDLAYEDWLH